MKTDNLKAIAGKYGKVSRKGLHTGILAGRIPGGYAGMKAGKEAFPSANIAEIYPHIDPGTLGPEEGAVYGALVGGYLLGGFGVAKGVTKYQELKEKDLEYTRPFLKPFEGIRSIKSFLEEDEEENITSEAFEALLEDEK